MFSRIIMLAGLLFSATASTASAEAPNGPPYNCLTATQGCTIILRLPDGRPGMFLKFHYCKATCDKDYPEDVSRPGHCLLTCDPSTRAQWRTHYLVPPEGEVCRNSDVGEAIEWIRANHPGWVLAGWGCVNKYIADM